MDAVREAGIRPFCTLYHWDLPQWCEDNGGWPNRNLAGYFADYAGIIAKELGDRVNVYAAFNMPSGTSGRPVHLPGFCAASNCFWRDPMTVNMNKHVPPKRPEVETPTELHETADPQQQEHKKMEHMADRAANKAAKDEQKYDQDHNTFTI